MDGYDDFDFFEEASDGTGDFGGGGFYEDEMMAASQSPRNPSPRASSPYAASPRPSSPRDEFQMTVAPNDLSQSHPLIAPGFASETAVAVSPEKQRAEHLKAVHQYVNTAKAITGQRPRTVECPNWDDDCKRTFRRTRERVTRNAKILRTTQRISLEQEKNFLYKRDAAFENYRLSKKAEGILQRRDMREFRKAGFRSTGKADSPPPPEIPVATKLRNVQNEDSLADSIVQECVINTTRKDVSELVSDTDLSLYSNSPRKLGRERAARKLGYQMALEEKRKAACITKVAPTSVLRAKGLDTIRDSPSSPRSPHGRRKPATPTPTASPAPSQAPSASPSRGYSSPAEAQKAAADRIRLYNYINSPKASPASF